jgi:hypothetical protein
MNIWTKVSLIGCVFGVVLTIILSNWLAALWAITATTLVCYVHMLENRCDD